jgi:hypothetical protein
MKGGFFLLLHSARRARSLLLTISVLLACFQLLLCLAARTLQQSGAFGQLSALIPQFLREFMGPSLISLMSFGGIVAIGYFHIAVIGGLVGFTVALATESAAEIESRFIDLILSRPLPRHWLITRSIVLISAGVTLTLSSMLLGTMAGLYWLAPPQLVPDTLRLVRSMVLNLGAMMLCWGGISLAVTSFLRRRSVAGALAGILALTSYLFDYIARVWTPAARFSWLSPFHYFSGMNLIAGDTSVWRDIRILLTTAVCGCVVAYVQFERRDL